jgi:alanine-glyoxylate transaminase / serine-glyoxylate transaminase / serine-pyruvate transaminase
MNGVGWHFLQIPGPTNVPGRVLRALAEPLIDHRGPEFSRLTLEVIKGVRDLARASGEVALFPSSGTGAWEAALVNTLSAGDAVLLCEHGQFARQWGDRAEQLGLRVLRLEGDWRRPPDPDRVAAALAREREVKAVLLVHNETSTGVTADVAGIRGALDRVGHSALYLVDAISSLGSIDYRHDEWGVDVTIGCSQKGLMLPPGLGINIVGPKARLAASSSTLPRSYWSWDAILESNHTGFFPYTPPTSLLKGLREALLLLHEEGLDDVFVRHARHAEATRAAVEGWGLDVFCLDTRAHSATLTTVVVPDEVDADHLRRTILERYDLSLGAGLGPLAGRVFRIGHLGAFNDLMLVATLAGVELGLVAAGALSGGGGVGAALAMLAAPRATAPAKELVSE